MLSVRNVMNVKMVHLDFRLTVLRDVLNASALEEHLTVHKQDSLGDMYDLIHEERSL